MANFGARVTKLFFSAVAVLVFLAPPLHAGKQPTLALEDLVERSDAIVVASVKSIDEFASRDPRAPLTTVELDVLHVLRGTLSDPSAFKMTFRGGVTPEGMRQQWTSVPPLAVGDEYVLFLRAEYYVSPLIPALNGVLRAVRVQGRKIAVDAGGRVIRASARHGLLYGGTVSKSLSQRHERAEPQRRVGPGSAAGVVGQDRMVAAGSDFDEVLELISSASSRAGRDTKPISASLNPMSLPRDAPQTNP